MLSWRKKFAIEHEVPASFSKKSSPCSFALGKFPIFQVLFVVRKESRPTFRVFTELRKENIEERSRGEQEVEKGREQSGNNKAEREVTEGNRRLQGLLTGMGLTPRGGVYE